MAGVVAIGAVVCVLVVGPGAGVARAQEPTAPAAPRAPTRDFHVGANLRTDFGARFYRVDLGVRLDRVDLIAVLDPFGLDLRDYDFDGIVAYRMNEHWSVFTGMRLTTVPIGRGRQYSEKLLSGVSVILPSLGIRNVRLHSGVELAVHIVSHGADLMTNWVCIDSPTCRKDHFVFGLFGRVEYVASF